VQVFSTNKPALKNLIEYTQLKKLIRIMKMTKQLPNLGDFIQVNTSLKLKLWSDNPGISRKSEHMGLIIGTLDPLHLKLKDLLPQLADANKGDLCRIT
jgi:hypothetical protein